MSNITTTNCDLGTVILKDAKFDDVSLKFPSADTYVEGTILARKHVADAVVVVAGTNTGNGTVTLATVAAGTIIPVVGAYVLTCTEAVTNGGVFKLVDPNGAIVATDLRMTAGAGAATVFEVAGLQFTVIEGCYSGSCFACKYEQFTFDWYAKKQIFFVKIWYYIKMNLWRKIRHQIPFRVKLFFNPVKNDGMPF